MFGSAAWYRTGLDRKLSLSNQNLLAPATKPNPTIGSKAKPER